MLLCKHQTNNQLNKTNMSDMLANCYHLAAVDKHNHDRHSLIHTSTGGKQEEVLFLVSKTIFFFFFFYACGKASLQQFVKQTAEEGKRLGLKCKQTAGKSCLVKRKIIKRAFFLSFSVLIQVIDFFFFFGRCYLHAFINWKSSTPATKLEALAQIPTVKSSV